MHNRTAGFLISAFFCTFGTWIITSVAFGHAVQRRQMRQRTSGNETSDRFGICHGYYSSCSEENGYAAPVGERNCAGQDQT